MTIDRRGFVRGMMAALAGGPVAVAATGEATTESGEPLTGDAALLGWCLQTFGDEPVCDGIAALLREGQFTVRELKRRLQRTKDKARRQARSRKHREGHGGDEVLYHGPVYVDDWQALLRHWHPSPSKRYDVARTRDDWAVYGRLAKRPEGYRAVERGCQLIGWAPDCEDYPIDAVVPLGMEPLEIPAGSRVLIGKRHDDGNGDTMACEVVRTAGGEYRIHLYRTNRQLIPGDGEPLPVLALAGRDQGRRFETTEEQPVVGLLGLPLSLTIISRKESNVN